MDTIKLVRRSDDVAYCIGMLPDRKRVALYKEVPGLITPVAYFTYVDEAMRFIDWLESILGKPESLDDSDERDDLYNTLGCPPTAGSF